jgi:hypothetical protein
LAKFTANRRASFLVSRPAVIAATAEVRDLTLITGNVSDFETSINAIINPWAEEEPQS